MIDLSRRAFLRNASAASLAYGGLNACAARRGELQTADMTYAPDPDGIFELAPGLGYRVLTRSGDPMSDGLLTPGAPDGMWAFPSADGKVHIVRNHELSQRNLTQEGAYHTNDAFSSGGDLPNDQIYDRGSNGLPAPGGTTTLVYDPASGQVEESWLSLSGTLINCAGGPTPWGSWLSCEEVVDIAETDGSKLHGYVFEVPSAHRGPAAPVPLKAMGRFKHEAVAIDPQTGAAYMTEDTRGLALFYRFLPDSPGELARGGRLQALAVRGEPGADLRNWDTQAAEPGQYIPVEWIDIADPDNPDGDLTARMHAAGAAQFTRGEGCTPGIGEVFFDCTDGGPARAGQVWRYRPTGADTGNLQLFVESPGAETMDHCDNMVMAPWGDLILAEDGEGENRLLGVTPEGRVYPIGRNTLSYKGAISELCGPCFSPDGSTLFFNIQRPGLTVAITGDWARVRAV